MGYRDNVNKIGTVWPWVSGANLPANTASANGQSISIAPGGYNAVAWYILAGTWTDGSHTFTVQEAPDNGSGAPGAWNAVAATDLSRLETANVNGGLPITEATAGSQPSAITSAATALSQRVGYLGSQPWTRMITTVSGATSGAKYFVVCITGEPRVLPAQV
jgi:hypothetical protein